MAKDLRSATSAYDSGMRGNEKPPAVAGKKPAPKGSKAAQDEAGVIDKSKDKKPTPKAGFKSFVKKGAPGAKKPIVHNRFKLAEDGEHYLVPKKMFDSGEGEGD